MLCGLSRNWSCVDDSEAARTLQCRAGRGLAWWGKCERGGEGLTNIVWMNEVMLTWTNGGPVMYVARVCVCVCMCVWWQLLAMRLDSFQELAG